MSPDLTGPTPAGVPVRITSYGSKVKYFEMYDIKYGTSNIISPVLPLCFMTPLTEQVRLTKWGSGIFVFGMNSLTGQAVSNPFAKSHGSPLALASF